MASKKNVLYFTNEDQDKLLQSMHLTLNWYHYTDNEKKVLMVVMKNKHYTSYQKGILKKLRDHYVMILKDEKYDLLKKFHDMT